MIDEEPKVDSSHCAAGPDNCSACFIVELRECYEPMCHHAADVIVSLRDEVDLLAAEVRDTQAVLSARDNDLIVQANDMATLSADLARVTAERARHASELGECCPRHVPDDTVFPRGCPWCAVALVVTERDRLGEEVDRLTADLRACYALLEAERTTHDALIEQLESAVGMDR